MNFNWWKSHDAERIAEALFRPVLMSSKARLVDNLVRLRKESDLSQSGLASLLQAMGLDHWRQTTVSRIEAKTQDLTAEDVMALGGVFGRALFEGTVLSWADDTSMSTGDAERDLALELTAAHQALAMAEAEVADAAADYVAVLSRLQRTELLRHHAEGRLRELRSRLGVSDPAPEMKPTTFDSFDTESDAAAAAKTRPGQWAIANGLQPGGWTLLPLDSEARDFNDEHQEHPESDPEALKAVVKAHVAVAKKRAKSDGEHQETA